MTFDIQDTFNVEIPRRQDLDAYNYFNALNIPMGVAILYVKVFSSPIVFYISHAIHCTQNLHNAALLLCVWL